ncbi:unnamed protein product [Haemonchus placei]|uniref:Malectin domain-containing protein n=1 Tax=Haemonchus placei TaxID=6290 RepID=A0A3P7XMG6_HAEPC|nr:unnamed protein product [Haemonchus placei]
MMTPFHIVLLFVIGLPSIEGKPPDLSKRVVHAVNCGGYRHVGAYGIAYQEDRNPVGVVSDYGARYTFPNVPIEDRKLYETERYHNGDLTYVFDIAKDGEYVIVLKFSEVYFQSVGQKVWFSVFSNPLGSRVNQTGTGPVSSRLKKLVQTSSKSGSASISSPRKEE